jgi:hypothetical protein
MVNEKAGGRGEQPDYQSYLLRLWRVGEGEEGWLASLESAHTGERRGFADLEAMLVYLRRETEGRVWAASESDEGASMQGGAERR